MNSLERWASSARWGLFRAKGGWCASVWTSKGLSVLILPRPNRAEALRRLHEYLPPLPEEFWERPPARVPQNIQTETQKALSGKKFRFSRFDLSLLTSFQQKVLLATCQIPWGQVRSYGWAAQKAGSPRGFRAAGQALYRNPVSLFIPCHRVIASGGRLGGYGGNVEWKARLLENEGLKVKRGIIRSGGSPAGK